jgi:hypothetical protein
MTLSQIPLVAGDSFDIDVMGLFRLSPLRRNLTLDAIVDLYAFYIPYRHIYQNWEAFMLDGVDESEVFTYSELGTGLQYIGLNNTNDPSGDMPLHQVAGYNRIINRYFRHPSDDSYIRADDAVETATDPLRYGVPIAYLKRMWNTGLVSSEFPGTEDRQVAVTSGSFDVLDLARVKARYKTEAEREWFGQRYADIMRSAFGAKISEDREERPTLIHRTKQWLSGYDVDGTGDASLGSFSGKGMSMVRMKIPRTFFPEHGTLWIMASVRFPPVHEKETHFLQTKLQPTYKEISGDPEIIEREGPIEIPKSDLFADISPTNTENTGYHPYGAWYREHPSIVHQRYREVAGFPFQRESPQTGKSIYYHGPTEYDSVFQTLQLGHWQSQCKINIDALRVVPPAIRSIYAGT